MRAVNGSRYVSSVGLNNAIRVESYLFIFQTKFILLVFVAPVIKIHNYSEKLYEEVMVKILVFTPDSLILYESIVQKSKIHKNIKKNILFHAQYKQLIQS